METSMLNHAERSNNKRQVLSVLILTSAYMGVEVVGGLLTGSLALLSDAGHMLTDVAGLGLSLIAIYLADRPPSVKRSYGYFRAEILAAVVNSLILFGISFFILAEAYLRFSAPPKVQGGTMLVIGSMGLMVNLVGLWIMRKSSQKSLNIQGAYFEVLSDALTSVGVIVAAIIIWRTGWYIIDPIVSAGIGLFILPRTWKLLTEAISVLLEGVPADVDVALLRKEILAVSGVSSLHDLHVWSLTSGVNALSAHVVIGRGVDRDQILAVIRSRLGEKFNISHVTVQVEREGFEESTVHE
ncbi:cation diffusion facilitator family transporter [bacterium]|nr:cation diffusion facilitator family transporter [bacterium]